MAIKFNRGKGQTKAILFGVVALIVVLVIVLLFRGSVYEGGPTPITSMPTTVSAVSAQYNTATGMLILETGNPPINNCSNVITLPSGTSGCSKISYAVYNDVTIQPITQSCILYDVDYTSQNHISKLSNLSGLQITSVVFTPSTTPNPTGATLKPGSVKGGSLSITSGGRTIVYNLVVPNNLVESLKPKDDSYKVVQGNPGTPNAQANMQPYFLLTQGQTPFQ